MKLREHPYQHKEENAMTAAPAAKTSMIKDVFRRTLLSSASIGAIAVGAGIIDLSRQPVLEITISPGK